jgi:hypothetical protein
MAVSSTRNRNSAVSGVNSQPQIQERGNRIDHLTMTDKPETIKKPHNTNRVIQPELDSFGQLIPKQHASSLGNYVDIYC